MKNFFSYFDEVKNETVLSINARKVYQYRLIFGEFQLDSINTIYESF